MITSGIIVCSRCGVEIEVKGRMIPSMGKDGELITELEPDIESSILMRAHKC